MDNNRIFGFCLIFFALSAPAHAQDPEGCPEEFWDGPTEACTAIIDEVLDELINGEWQVADIRINNTCRAYDETQSCMEALMERCRDNEVAVDDLRQIMGRYKPYSLPCHNDHLRHRQRLVDCFHTHIPGTRRCVNKFDDSFHMNVLRDQFELACKDVEMVMECFTTTKATIMDSCGAEGAEEYSLDYILPVVKPTTPTVVKSCPDLPSPHREYFGLSSGAAILSTDLILFGVLSCVFVMFRI